MWQLLPDVVKQEIFQAVKEAKAVDTLVVDLLSEIVRNVDDVLDLTHMNREIAEQDPSKVTQVFLRVRQTYEIYGPRQD